MRRFTQIILHRPAGLLLLAAAVLLMLPGGGALCASAAGLALALAAWSYASEQLPGSETNLRYASHVLAAGATLRLIGQVLRVHPLRATPLMLEAYALRTLAGLHQSPRGAPKPWRALRFATALLAPFAVPVLISR